MSPFRAPPANTMGKGGLLLFRTLRPALIVIVSSVDTILENLTLEGEVCHSEPCLIQPRR